MTKITENRTPVISPITPGSDDSNEWATHIAKYGRGGFEIVDTIAERDAITDDRKEDKAVWVRDVGNNTPALFEWNKTDWKKIEIQSSNKLSVQNDDGVFFGDINALRVSNSRLTKQGAYPKRADIETFVNVRDEKTYLRKTNDIRVFSPLTISSNSLFDNGLDLGFEPSFKTGIDDALNKREMLHSDGYVSYAQRAYVLKSFNGTDDSDSYLFFPDPYITLTKRSITADEKTKTITIQSNDYPSKTNTPYFLAFQLYSESAAQKDGQVTVSVVDSTDTTVAIKDINNEFVAKTIMLKKGDIVGRIYLEAVIIESSKRAIKFKVQSTCGEIVLNSLVNGVTGMIVSEISGNGIGTDIHQWALDTGEMPRFDAYDFNGHFVSTPNIATLESEGFANGKQFGTNTQINTIDNISVFSEDAFNLEIKDGNLHIKGTKFFTFGMVIDSDRTRLMRGNRYYMYYQGKPITSDVKMVAAFWYGEADNLDYPTILDIKPDKHPNLDAGYKKYTQKTVKKESDGKSVNEDFEFGVPDDAVNMVILVMPEDDSVVQDIGIERVFVTPRNNEGNTLMVISDDKFAGVPLETFDRTLPLNNSAIKKFKNTSREVMTVFFPPNGFVDVKVNKISSTGVLSNVNDFTYSYDPSNHEFIINFNSTSDYVVAITLLS